MTSREVCLDGGSPWGFRMHGGVDVNQPLRISRVNPGSKAALRGIREGDLITSINGQSTKDISNAEAHNLLRNAGEILKLGLNEDISGSPKRRQYRTVHQETHSETIKRSTVTTYSIKSSKTTEDIETTQDDLKENSDSKICPLNNITSQRSTLSTNCSSSPSTLSDLAGNFKSSSHETNILERSPPPYNTNPTSSPSSIITEVGNNGLTTMADNSATVITRSQKRRARKKARKSQQNNNNNNNITPTISIDDEHIVDYRVDSPETVEQNTEKKPMRKSRSLDDDEIVKIQELNDDDNNSLSTISLKLDDPPQVTIISTEDELKLRHFLEGLNLVNSPENAVKQIYEKSTSETIKQQRAKKRLALEQYFMPQMENPRYLDVISEETSDFSDKEPSNLTRHLKQGTPEMETKPPVPMKMKKTVKKIAKPQHVTTVAEVVCCERAQGVEVVYLDDDSSSSDNEETTKLEENNIILNELTPPPTPDENFQQNETVFSNVITPSRSPSSDGSSSHTLSTTKYNPNCSIADIQSICKDEELLKNDQLKFNPLTLREICINFLLTLPFGIEILQELADVSSSIDNLTNCLPSQILPKIAPNLPHFTNNNNNVTNFVDEIRSSEDATRKEDTLNVCKVVNNQSGLDRLLAIIQNEPFRCNSITYNNIPSSQHQQDVNDDEENCCVARLKAKNLSEWLELAREKTIMCDTTSNMKKRRSSLPQDLYKRQMIYIEEKEREIQRELERLEEEKLKLATEMARTSDDIVETRQFQPNDYVISRRGDYAIHNEGKLKIRPMSMPTEFFRQQMYEEYMSQIAEREERKQQKVIKLSNLCENNCDNNNTTKKILNTIIDVENEFMEKVKEKQKQGILLERKSEEKINQQQPATINSNDNEVNCVLVIDGNTVKKGITEQLPKHLQEFVDITNSTTDGVWSPGQKPEPIKRPEELIEHPKQTPEDESSPQPPVWTPKSANSSPTVERKEFRPVNFQSPKLERKQFTKTTPNGDNNTNLIGKSIEPPWKFDDNSQIIGQALEKRLTSSQSSPASGFSDISPSPRLPKAQNPTITLLQKAREGQLPKGAHYLDQQSHFERRFPNERPALANPGDVLVYKIKNEYTSESDSERPRKMADLGPRKYDGIGPTTKNGMPLTLRSEVKDANQSKWYKRMYDTIHKPKLNKDEYVTVRYKQRRALYPYTSGYLSEPEPGAYDSDYTDYKYATLDRRRQPLTERSNEYLTNAAATASCSSSTMPRNLPNKSSSSSDIVRNSQGIYKNQPGRIENYMPGHSSISEKEAKEWWDEVMDIFDGQMEQQKRVPQTKSFINQALKESGYESDSTLIFRRKEEAAQQLSPSEQKEAYKAIQKGGDVPLHGLRKPAPERPKESPRKYVENQVTIHYKTPVRQEIKECLSEDELAHRQAEVMKKIYQEERRRKYLQVSNSLQELQDMNSRRHTDNFIPSQKSPIPLNRYDDFECVTTAPVTKPPPPRSPEPRLVARALYNFVGQTARELTFRKGDLIYVRRQVDKNWYEGELNAMVGLFPVNYVEIVHHDGIRTPQILTQRKSHEGQARAKYNFVAQTHLELSLAKGELVIITRKVDENWFEGKIGGRKGIFPISYVEVLIDPQDPQPISTKPVASPAAHSLLHNGTAGGKESMGAHLYTPNLPTTTANSYHAKPVQIDASGTYSTLNRNNPVDQALHIDTQSEPIPYRALYKYKPQNDDELELFEGDIVYVLEKCDDGWYVGSSERTGAFGTFPGNYVEKI